MKYNPEIHNRRSIRLQKYDYALAGAYFVTVCTQNRECLFGDMVDGKMSLNDAGRMIQLSWDELPIHYSGVETDAFIVMPNHVHGVIVLVGAGPRACPEFNFQPQPGGQPQGVAPTTLSLPDLVHRFKTITTKRYTDGVKQTEWKPFLGKLWQRNYYEHIVRNEKSLNKIREYIINNPAQWEFDHENPATADVKSIWTDLPREKGGEDG